MNNNDDYLFTVELDDSQLGESSGGSSWACGILAPGCAHGLILHGDHPPAANTPTLVRIQADTRASRSPGSTRRGTRLIVDWRRQGPPDLQAQSPRADRDPGRRRARASPTECGTPPGRPPRPGTRPRPGRGRTPRRSRGSATP